ncbi:MAG: hypothetical protein HYV27_00965 [Candidatus Hydrogenedentes bacterium]|nr:hypothetical protein [Candidatus Hydrogenedentota bacterium]
MYRCVLIVVLAVACVAAGEGLPYDPVAGRWLVDAEGVVARNDVVYDTPSVEPWEAMPVGGGDLSAMVRCDGADLHLHLSKSDAWGFAAPADAPEGTRFFNNVSPGHVRVHLGARGVALARMSFEQRLDLYRGRVVVTLGGDSGLRAVVWGDPHQRVLVLEIAEGAQDRTPIQIELSEWRDTMRVAAREDGMVAQEIQTRAARPHLASAGMQDYFDDTTDPLLNRELAVAVTAPGVEGLQTRVEGSSVWLDVPAERPERFAIVIACETSPKAGALDAALASARSVTAQDLPRKSAEHAAWWQDYWSRSFIRLESPDNSARWVTAAYYVHLYTLGCVNRGAVPAKWDGGPGLLRNDDRTWGLAEWIQEVRFTYLPLYAADCAEMARGLPRHYTAMRPYLREQTRTMWGLDGLWIPETVLPWGGIEDWVLDADGKAMLSHYQPWDPASAPHGKFEAYNPYVGFLFTAGLELCWHYLTFARYWGDDAFLREEAYPMLRDVCVFTSALLRQGADGRYHLDPANALETWWLAGDPADTLDGIRAIFPEFIRLSEIYGLDAEARARCAAQLAALPEPSIGVWNPDGRIDPTVDAYAAAGRMGTPPRSSNFENPALYRVFPFGLSGIGTADRDRAVRTFEHRIFTNVQGWSMDAIWAARLGLRDRACALLLEHARKWNRFRYGGWDSDNSNDLPEGLALSPYLDAGGVSAYALQAILLQSHNQTIRIAPALADGWSAVFRLRAEGSFVVTASVRGAEVGLVEIASERGGPCVLMNPWPGACAVRDGDTAIVSTEEREVRFETVAGHRYLLEPKEAPQERFRAVPLHDQANERAGLPGRDN